ncbi:putative MarR family transcriptional regulator [Methanocella paludicola SANAE]|uniref:MarR family transcriptional regulator n=2 Tax=Methanocella TaxID=570266 RepID=D1Z2P4_METPS|nr:putative MarR family transcriptional regulator [Methanocella paludicola SANAE]
MAKFILVMVFLIEQRWSYYIGKDLEEDGITTKQWLMALVIANGFKHAPSIQEVADAMSTTHQNVKQIASGMERQGLMRLERDEKNKRIIRLRVTEHCFRLFKSREEGDVRAVLSMFENISDDELRALFNVIAKMEHRADELYEGAKAMRKAKEC